MTEKRGVLYYARCRFYHRTHTGVPLVVFVPERDGSYSRPLFILSIHLQSIYSASSVPCILSIHQDLVQFKFCVQASPATTRHWNSSFLTFVTLCCSVVAFGTSSLTIFSNLFLKYVFSWPSVEKVHDELLRITHFQNRFQHSP